MSETQAGVLVLLAIPVLYALMWWGWRRRARAQEDVPAPPEAPQDPGPPLLEPREAVYVSTTTEGDWLARVSAHGLGRRSACEVGVFAGGVSVARDGEGVLWLPGSSLVRVRRERGMAGKYVDREGLVVLTWRLDGSEQWAVDTGLRLRRDDDADALVAALAPLVGGAAGPGPAADDAEAGAPGGATREDADDHTGRGGAVQDQQDQQDVRDVRDERDEGPRA